MQRWAHHRKNRWSYSKINPAGHGLIVASKFDRLSISEHERITLSDCVPIVGLRMSAFALTEPTDEIPGVSPLRNIENASHYVQRLTSTLARGVSDVG